MQENQINQLRFSGADLLDTVTNNLQIGILIENESGLVVSVNQVLCDYLNIAIPIKQLIGTDIINNDYIDQTRFVNPFYFKQRTNEILNNRVEVRNDLIELRDGTIIERDFIPLYEKDNYKGHIWYYNNATEKNKLSIKIDQQKEVYEKILSHLPVDIAVLKPAYADLFLNPLVIKDTDLRQWIIEWLISKNNDAKRFPELDASEIKSYKNLFRHVMTNKISGQIEEKKIDDNGKIQILLRSLNPILDEDGNIEMLIGYNTDISERVKIEDELKAAKNKTEELSKAKDLFLANISHEIRTPMNGILGVVHLLGKTKLNQQQHKMASMINDAASNLLVIVNDILHLEKITSGKIDLEELPFSLTEKISNLIASFQISAQEKNLHLSFENKIINHPIVIGDPYRFSQIINNLIGNAIKFTEAGSIVVILNTITETQNEIWIRVEIKDTGIGIEPEKIEQLFEPYKQAETSTTRKYGGTGLGLSICKNLAELLGGRIGVDSHLGTGSTFSCSIPFKKQTTSANPIQAEPDYHPLKGCKVLLADDVEMNQFIARSFLEDKNMKVTIASDGRAVIELVENNEFDIILMDIAMPFIDGIQATSIIRSMKDSKRNSIPILAITANTLKGDEKKYIDAGMNGYISKPFQEDQLLSAIIKTLQSKKFIVSSMDVTEQPVLLHKLYNESLIMGMGKNKPAFVEKMIGLFLKTMPTDMNLLEAAANNKDWHLVEKTAHRMKSAIRGMGIEIAVEPIKRIEEMAQTSPSHSVLLIKIKSLNAILLDVINQINTDYPHINVPK